MNTTDSRHDHDGNTLLGLGLSDVLGPLLPEREGQPRTLTMAMPWEHERVHWYSPAAVREMLAAERERCAMVCISLERRGGNAPGVPDGFTCAAAIRRA